MMTVTRKREGAVEPNLGKKMAEPNLGKKKPPAWGVRLTACKGFVLWVSGLGKVPET